jgi:hypothetical protein
MDSLEHCLNKRHFVDYPHSIEYTYNSRGFRDRNWPDSLDELRNAVWCIGDSFTVGIGQPLAHIWPQVLSDTINRRTINISMDGASNDWIYRRAIDIIRYINPVHMVVMWSYTKRRESDRIDMPDEDRRIETSKESSEQDYDHWLILSNRLHTANDQVIQTTIPDYIHLRPEYLWNTIKGPDWPPCPQNISELENLPSWVVKELSDFFKCYTQLKDSLRETQKKHTLSQNLLADVIHIHKRLDWARDHHHFDILTSQWLVDRIMPRLAA